MKEKREKINRRIVRTIFRYILLSLLLLAAILVFIFLILRMNYAQWKEDYDSADLVVLNLEGDLRDFEDALESKIIDYNTSESGHSFLELNQEESIFLFSRALEESLPTGFEVKKMALISEPGNWYIYFKTDFNSFSFPWIAINLMKEDVQSVNVYVEDLFLGNMSFRKLFLGFLVDSVNQGIRNSIELVNDGNFAGKVFENIELRENGLVIRSRRVSL
jgi:hypothetical protein